jgi:hypothetical protein
MQDLGGKFERKRTRDRWDDGRENNIKTVIEETELEIVWNFNIFRLCTGWTIHCLDSRQLMCFSLLLNRPLQPWDPHNFLFNTYGVLSFRQSGQIVKLSAHLHFLLRLRMPGTLFLLPV